MIKSSVLLSIALEKSQLSEWKERIVGLVFDWAALMAGRGGLEGVTTTTTYLLNLQRLGYNLELAAMNAMKSKDRI